MEERLILPTEVQHETVSCPNPWDHNAPDNSKLKGLLKELVWSYAFEIRASAVCGSMLSSSIAFHDEVRLSWLSNMQSLSANSVLHGCSSTPHLESRR